MTAVNELQKDMWEDDKLDIKQNVINFANILNQEKFTPNENSKVYAISAKFGVGKTFFCTKLHNTLKQEKTPVSLLNIWEMDFYDNPLIPILIKLQETYIGSAKSADHFPKISKIVNLFKSGASALSGKLYFPTFGELEFDGDKAIKCHEQLKQNMDLQDIYTEYQQIKTELNNLKSFLRNWAEAFGKPIVIIIDELDRCKPDYAVKTLEVLKHFFNIPGFIFILAIDEAQLQSSVEKLFGTKNFDGYKRKFINNSFILPEPDKAKFTDFLYEKSGLANVIKEIESNNKDLIFKATEPIYTDPMYAKIKEYNKTQKSEKIIKRYFTAYSIWFNFSLRQMEQVFDRLVLFSKNFLNNNELFSPDLAVLLVCLHEFDLKIYNKLRSSSDKVYGQYGGVLKHIYNNNKDNFSFARSLYNDEADKLLALLDRKIVPKVPELRGFSTTEVFERTDDIIIHDDVDRFFVAESSQRHPLAWIVEIHDNESGINSMIQNNGRIVVIINSKRDIAWKNIPADIDTASYFDLEQFRQKYFDNMDFISHFK